MSKNEAVRTMLRGAEARLIDCRPGARSLLLYRPEPTGIEMEAREQAQSKVLKMRIHAIKQK